MNNIFWNCKGVGKKAFPSLVKDLTTTHELNLMAFFEPRISGSMVDEIIKKLDMHSSFRVDVDGFSGGLQCIWNYSALNVTVLNSSKFHIHLHVNPLFVKVWYLTFVYASPQVHHCHILWE